MTKNNVLSYLEEAAKKYPHRVALKDDTKSIEYGELEYLCKRLALNFLEAIGSTPPDLAESAPASCPAPATAESYPASATPPAPESPIFFPGIPRPVVVYIDRNIDSIIAFLSVVYSGNFYVPVDASFPAERLQAINKNLNPVLFIDARNKGKEIEGALSLKNLIAAIGPAPARDPAAQAAPETAASVRSPQTAPETAASVRSPQAAPETAASVRSPQTAPETAASVRSPQSTPEAKNTGRSPETIPQTAPPATSFNILDRIRENSIDTDPLYSIFTSGTTGVPKGVLISHRSVIDLLEQFDKAFVFPDYPVFGNQAPFDFDVSVKDIYNSLKHAGCVVVIPKKHFVMSASLFPYLKENDINVIIWAVSALRIAENFRLFDTVIPDKLKLVMFSGEVMPPRTLNYLKKYLPETVFVNLYGPTEITCNCNYYIIDRDFADRDEIPIGKSFVNTRVFLVDVETSQIITTPDTTGEICVEGSSLALGYYNNEAETDKAFKQRPDVGAFKDLIYHTGDLGKYNDKGELFYISRKDYQIKHMGHRIELGEIEAVVNAMDAIHNGCCVYDDKRELIVLFYSGDKESDKEIRSAIRAALPGYMMPNKIVFLDKMPMNSHDKTDRKRLSDMAKELA